MWHTQQSRSQLTSWQSREIVPMPAGPGGMANTEAGLPQYWCCLWRPGNLPSLCVSKCLHQPANSRASAGRHEPHLLDSHADHAGNSRLVGNQNIPAGTDWFSALQVSVLNLPGRYTRCCRDHIWCMFCRPSTLESSCLRMTTVKVSLCSPPLRDRLSAWAIWPFIASIPC